MMVYSSDGKYIIDPNKQEEIEAGTYGKIYKYDDNTCFKVFKYEGFHKPDPIIMIKELSLKNFCKIYDLLYDQNLQYKGYIMKYYQQDGFDILSDKDYLLDSVNGIYDGIMELTRHLFQVADLHLGNIIINKDGMTIIDFDDFRKFSSNNTYINISRYKNLLRELLYRYLTYHHPKELIEGLMLIDRLLDKKSSDLVHLNQTLRLYKKPIDYFNKVL